MGSRANSDSVLVAASRQTSGSADELHDRTNHSLHPAGVSTDSDTETPKKDPVVATAAKGEVVWSSPSPRERPCERHGGDGGGTAGQGRYDMDHRGADKGLEASQMQPHSPIKSMPGIMSQTQSYQSPSRRYVALSQGVNCETQTKTFEYSAAQGMDESNQHTMMHETMVYVEPCVQAPGKGQDVESTHGTDSGVVAKSKSRSETNTGEDEGANEAEWEVYEHTSSSSNYPCHQALLPNLPSQPTPASQSRPSQTQDRYSKLETLWPEILHSFVPYGRETVKSQEHQGQQTSRVPAHADAERCSPERLPKALETLRSDANLSAVGGGSAIDGKSASASNRCNLSVSQQGLQESVVLTLSVHEDVAHDNGSRAQASNQMLQRDSATEMSCPGTEDVPAHAQVADAQRAGLQDARGKAAQLRREKERMRASEDLDDLMSQDFRFPVPSERMSVSAVAPAVCVLNDATHPEREDSQRCKNLMHGAVTSVPSSPSAISQAEPSRSEKVAAAAQSALTHSKGGKEQSTTHHSRLSDGHQPRGSRSTKDADAVRAPFPSDGVMSNTSGTPPALVDTLLRTNENRPRLGADRQEAVVDGASGIMLKEDAKQKRALDFVDNTSVSPASAHRPGLVTPDAAGCPSVGSGGEDALEEPSQESPVLFCQHTRPGMSHKTRSVQLWTEREASGHAKQTGGNQHEKETVLGSVSAKNVDAEQVLTAPKRVKGALSEVEWDTSPIANQAEGSPAKCSSQAQGTTEAAEVTPVSSHRNQGQGAAMSMKESTRNVLVDSSFTNNSETIVIDEECDKEDAERDHMIKAGPLSPGGQVDTRRKEAAPEELEKSTCASGTKRARVGAAIPGCCYKCGAHKSTDWIPIHEEGEVKSICKACESYHKNNKIVVNALLPEEPRAQDLILFAGDRDFGYSAPLRTRGKQRVSEKEAAPDVTLDGSQIYHSSLTFDQGTGSSSRVDSTLIKGKCLCCGRTESTGWFDDAQQHPLAICASCHRKRKEAPTSSSRRGTRAETDGVTFNLQEHGNCTGSSASRSGNKRLKSCITEHKHDDARGSASDDDDESEAGGTNEQTMMSQAFCEWQMQDDDDQSGYSSSDDEDVNAHKVFAGHNFLLTGMNKTDKIVLTQQIKAHGGNVLESKQQGGHLIETMDPGKEPTKLLLLSAEPCMTFNFLCGLACGLAVVSTQWVAECLVRKQLFPIDSYRLDAGYDESTRTRFKVPKNFGSTPLPLHERFLGGKRVAILGNEPFRIDLMRMVRFAGGEVVEVDNVSINFIICDSSLNFRPTSNQILDACRRDIPLVKQEWLSTCVRRQVHAPAGGSVLDVVSIDDFRVLHLVHGVHIRLYCREPLSEASSETSNASYMVLKAGPNEVKAVPTVQKQTPGLNDWHRFSPEMEAGLGRNTIWVVEQKLADRQFPTRRFSLRSLATGKYLSTFEKGGLVSFDDEAENCEHMIFHELSASRTEVDESSFHHRKVKLETCHKNWIAVSRDGCVWDACLPADASGSKRGLREHVFEMQLLGVSSDVFK